MVFVYVLKGDKKRYVGITQDLARRLFEHKAAHSRVRQMLGEFTLVLTEEFPDHASARKREVFLKSGQGRQWLDFHFPRSEPAKGG